MGSRLILLDTNYLIRLLVAGSDEAAQVRAWVNAGETLCTAAICWYEFCCGPVGKAELDVVRALLSGGIVALTETSAQRSADLWNNNGRRRTLRVDSLVAGTAAEAGAPVATSNLRDFSPFGSTISTIPAIF